MTAGVGPRMFVNALTLPAVRGPMPEIGSTTREEVDMKQLLQALTSDASCGTASRCVPSSAYACAPARAARLGLGSSVRHHAAMRQTTIATKGRFATLHGANRLMVSPTNAHRRPPETPT